MRRDLRGALKVLALATLALLFVLAFVPGRVPLAVRSYALVVCALGLGLCLLALRRAYPPVPPLHPKPEPASRARRPPPLLARMEDELALGVAGAFDLHHRLAPRLRAIAAGLLLSRHRVSLDGDPEEARRILGEETWEIVRADRASPEDRLARGISPAELVRVIDSQERA